MSWNQIYLVCVFIFLCEITTLLNSWLFNWYQSRNCQTVWGISILLSYVYSFSWIQHFSHLKTIVVHTIIWGGLIPLSRINQLNFDLISIQALHPLWSNPWLTWTSIQWWIIQIFLVRQQKSQWLRRSVVSLSHLILLQVLMILFYVILMMLVLILMICWFLWLVKRQNRKQRFMILEIKLRRKTLE